MTGLRRSLRLVLAAMSVFALVGFPAPVARAVEVPQSKIVSANPDDWTPQVLDGRVNAIVQVGNTVVAGGTFTQVRKTNSTKILTRNFIFAFTYGTGAIDSNFVPQLDGEVETLVPGPDGHSVIAGGSFNNVNGQAFRKIVRLDVDTGAIETDFKSNANSLVNDLVVNGNTLYVAGKFSQIHGAARSGVAALDLQTGGVHPNFNVPFTDPLRGALEVKKIDVSPDGSQLVAIGSFSQVGGLPRIQIAMLDLTTSPVSVSSWRTDQFPVNDPGDPTMTWCSPKFDTYMRDVDIDPTGTYFVVVSTGAYRRERLCDSVSRWPLGTTGAGQMPTWVDWTGGDTSTSVSVTGAAVYVGGHMRWFNNPYVSNAQGPGAVSRQGIGALDPVNGLPFNWNPTRKRGVGVFAMPSTADGLYEGSDTDQIGHEFHARVAFFPLAGGETVPPNNPYQLPADLYNMEYTSGNLLRRTFDGSAFGSSSTVSGVDWKNARGAFALNGLLYSARSDGALTVRTFDGTTFGSPSTIDLNGLDVAPGSTWFIPGTSTPIPPLTTQFASASGMFFDKGRLFYTVENDPRLYMRYFTPESQVVGANLFVASTGDGVTWADVRGMTLANNTLYFATKDGKLWRVAWNGNHPTGAVTQIGGPGIDSYNWASRGLFVFKQNLDTFAPSKPGTPTGSSSTTDSIDISWGASADAGSSTLTYHVYRDGGLSPVGSVVTDSTTTVDYHDGSLVSGTSHTYTVDATDAANNTSAMSDPSAPIVVETQDLTPPTDPGTPTGTSNSTSTIDLSWAASTDNVSTSITYRIYRDDPTNQIGTVTSSSTGTIDFQDTGLVAGSSHTYWVDAIDEADNPSGKSESLPIQVLPIIFSDDFSSGDFSKWSSVTNLTIDGANGGVAPPSALGSELDQIGKATQNLPSTYDTICMSENVEATDLGGNSVNLMRLRGAGGANILRVYVTSGGTLYIRSDVSGLQRSSHTDLGSGWHLLEVCGTVGTSSSWDLYRDGNKIVNDWVADTGTNGVGRVDIGDPLPKTWTINFDDVTVDQSVG